jgi:AcrR family transcriptional regulator
MCWYQECDIMKDPVVRQKLLLAAIESIEKFGIENTTIRAIAKEADVSFSSLHYYFESKDQMVEEALVLAVGNAFDDLDNIWQARTNDLVAIREMLLFLFDGALRYPGVTRASMHALLMKGQPEGVAHDMFNRVISVMIRDSAISDSDDMKSLPHRLIAAFSATLFAGISPKAFSNGTQIDYTQPENRVRLVDTLVQGLFQ